MLLERARWLIFCRCLHPPRQLCSIPACLSYQSNLVFRVFNTQHGNNHWARCHASHPSPRSSTCTLYKDDKVSKSYDFSKVPPFGTFGGTDTDLFLTKDVITTVEQALALKMKLQTISNGELTLDNFQVGLQVR